MRVEDCGVSRKICFIVFWLIVFSVCQVLNLTAQEKNSPSRSSNLEESIVVKTNLISFNVSVTGADGVAVSGLSKENFSIFDNKTPQEIHFFSSEDAPASISIILDTSGSMSGKKIEQAKRALAGFIQTSKPEDEFFLIDVGSKANLLLSRTKDSEALLEKLTFVEPKGNTALYDAVSLGIEKADGGSYARKIVLIISDGEDNNSRMSFRKLKNSLKESNAVVYAIGIESYLSYFGKGPSGLDILKELAEESGGKAYFPKRAEELNDVFERIALDIRHLYSIGYYPSEHSLDGKNHRITVKVKPADESTRLIVRSRKEYKPEINSVKR
jgi:Ca-activated chloride channel family protein